MVRGRRARTNVATTAAATSIVSAVNGNPQLTDDQYCASPKRKDCKIDDARTNLKAALQAITTSRSTSSSSSSSVSVYSTTTTAAANSRSPITTTITECQSSYGTFGAKTRSQAIRNYFRTNKIINYHQNNHNHQSTPSPTFHSDDIEEDYYTNGDTIGAELEVRTSCTPIDLTEDTCDDLFGSYVGHNNQHNNKKNTNVNDNNDKTAAAATATTKPEMMMMFTTNNKCETTNIFLQEPVLSLNVDKSPNQPSSIKINRSIEVDPVFSSSNSFQLRLNGQFNRIVDLSSNNCINKSPKKEPDNNSILLQQNGDADSNSCDSGVVFDKQIELSPNRRRKPTTPHRILCPSPVKHASVETSPSSALSHMSLMNGGGLVPSATAAVTANGIHKRNPKSRRRLNTPQSENNSSKTTPQLVGGVTLSQQALKKFNGASNNISQKSILNSAINPTAEQNTNNNYKKNQIRTNGQIHHTPNHHHHHHHHHIQTREKNGIHQSSQQHRGEKVQQQDTNKKLTDFFPVRRSVRKTKKAVQEELMRSFEKAIIEGREEGLKIENFEGKGRGVVAKKLFKRGEFVVEYIGDLINLSEANQRERKYSLDENTGCYMYYFKHRSQQYCIDATAETGRLGRLVNHSRNGNLITKVVVVKNHPHLVLLAKDDIKPGEELTYDYGDRSKEALMHHPWLAL